MRKTLSICLLVIVLTLSACSSATNTPAPLATSTVTSGLQDTATPTSAPTLQAKSVPQQAAAQNPLDPCALIPDQEASILTGVTFGSGKEGSSPNGLRSCSYSSQSNNVFMVEVAQAPDASKAKEYKAQFLADLKASLQQLTDQGMIVTELPNFADGAVMATISINYAGIAYNGISMGFLKGKTYFGFSDLSVGGSVPSSQAIQSEATTILSRLP